MLPTLIASILEQTPRAVFYDMLHERYRLDRRETRKDRCSEEETLWQAGQ